MKKNNYIDFQCIKDSVSVQKACNRYGISIKRKGNKLACICPFHPDKNPSLFIYPNNSWYCFGCAEHGDVINFVSKLFNCTSFQAAQKLNEDFGLNLSQYEHSGGINTYAIQHNKEKNQFQELLKWRDETYDCMCMVYKKCLKILNDATDLEKLEAACNLLPRMDYWLDILLVQEVEDLKALRKEIGDIWNKKNLPQSI